MKYKVCLLNYRGHESGKNGRYAGKLCQKNLANWRSVLKERIGRDKCTVLLFGRKKEQHKHRVQALGRTMLFSSSWNLESQGSGHSLSDLCHCGKDSQNNRCIQNENCEASEVSNCCTLDISGHCFKKKNESIADIQKSNRNWDLENITYKNWK